MNSVVPLVAVFFLAKSIDCIPDIGDARVELPHGSITMGDNPCSMYLTCVGCETTLVEHSGYTCSANNDMVSLVVDEFLCSFDPLYSVGLHKRSVLAL